MLSYGFSVRHWQMIEAGRPITMITLLRVAEAFELQPEETPYWPFTPSTQTAETVNLEGLHAHRFPQASCPGASKVAASILHCSPWAS
jgi:hypothetical protein